jgi:hypothetical protein
MWEKNVSPGLAFEKGYYINVAIEKPVGMPNAA